MLGESRAQTLEVAEPQCDRATSGRAAGRVRETDETLTLVGLEQLDQRGEPLLAGALRKRQLLDRVGRSPWSRDRLRT